MRKAHNFIDLSGKTFGRLTVLERADNSAKGNARWKCQCECGNETVVSGYDLRSGKTQSCGCQRGISSHKTHFEDLSNMKFGKLTVIERAENAKERTMWKCMCDCGNIAIVGADMLKSGRTQSCGCLKFESRNYTHNLSKTRLYNIWSKMKDRCYNENSPAYKWYGARGITVCDEWLHDFQAFYDWAMANGYRDNLTIDRRDTNGDYEPSNCRWTDWVTQANNTRSTVFLTYHGETKTVTEWSKITGIKRNTLLGRKRIGYTDEECIDVPLCSRRGKKRSKS